MHLIEVFQLIVLLIAFIPFYFSSTLASKFTNIQAHLSATAKVIVISCDPSVSTEGIGTEKPFTVDLPSITESGTQVVAEDLNRLLATCTLALFGKDEPDEIIQCKLTLLRFI